MALSRAEKEINEAHDVLSDRTIVSHCSHPAFTPRLRAELGRSLDGSGHGSRDGSAANTIAGISEIKAILVVISPQDKPEVVRVKIKELRDELEHRSSNQNWGEDY